MSSINYVTGRAYRTLVDNTPGAFVWNQLSFWTAASDVVFTDNQTAQQKVGNILGITTSTSVTGTGYAADASVVSGIYKRVNQYVSSTLNRGNTQLQFTNSNFNANTHFDVWTNIFGVAPTSMSLSGTTLTIDFPVQDSNMAVQVFYFNIT